MDLHRSAVLSHKLNEVPDMILMSMTEEPCGDDGSAFRFFEKKTIQSVLFASGEVSTVYDDEAAVLQLDYVTHATVNGGLIKFNLI